MINNTRRNSRIRRIINFLTMLIIVWSITPYCRRNIPIIYIGGIMTLWIIFFIILKKNSVTKRPKYIFVSIIWLIYIFAYRFIGISDAAWGNYFNELLFFMFVWIGYYYVRDIGEHYCELILKNTFIIATVNIIHNIYLLFKYPKASEVVNYSNIYDKTNVGASVFSLFGLVLFCILIIMIVDDSKKSKKSMHVILAVLCVIYIFQAARASIIIFLIISSGIYLYMKLIYKKMKYEKIIYGIFITFLVLILILNSVYLLKVISNNIVNDRLAIRLNAISSVLSGDISVDNISLVGRLELYKLSIATFFESFKNFIFGVGYHTTTSLSIDWLYSVGVGNHSEFLDLAARYGMIGIVIIYSFFRRFIKKLKKYYYRKDGFKFSIIWIIFFMYSLVNNTFDPSIGVLIFLVFPIYLKNRYIQIEKEDVAVSN